MLITPQYPVSPGTMARNASTAEHPFIWKGNNGSWAAGIDPSAHDLSGRGHNGTFVGNVSYSQFVGFPAWVYDGTSDAITTGATSLNPPFSYLAWVNPNSLVQYRCIVGSSGTAGQFLLSGGAVGDLAYLWNNTAAEYNWASGVTLPINIWSLVALVMEPTSTTVYMRNASGYSTASRTSITNAAATLGVIQIGQDRAVSDHVWSGGIGQASIFSRVLSAWEFNRYYELTSQDRTAWARRKPLSIPYAPAAAPAGGGTFPFNLYYGGGLV